MESTEEENQFSEAEKEIIQLEQELAKTKRDLEKQINHGKHLTKMGNLASSLSHNLRNPLAVIISTVGIIEATSKDTLDKNTLDRLYRISIAATNMSHQIEGVLDFVRNQPLDLEENSLSKILESSINNIEIPTEINLHLPEKEILLECDGAKLQVVFMNLITNSIQAMENKGDIFIRNNNDSKNILIEFEDSGPGIPSDVLPRIFDSLFTTKSAGTGLGLAYCKSIVEQHGGTIQAQNTPTKFILTFPKTEN